jgi:hypothetical protein
MMPLPARAGLRPRPRVRARVDRERRRPVPRPHRDQQVPQRLLIDPAPGQGLADHAVPAAEPRLQAQVRQRRHRPRCRQHRLRRLEQCVRAPPQAPVEPPPEPRQARQRRPGPGQPSWNGCSWPLILGNTAAVLSPEECVLTPEIQRPCPNVTARYIPQTGTTPVTSPYAWNIPITGHMRNSG